MATYKESPTRCILLNDLPYINQNDWTIGSGGGTAMATVSSVGNYGNLVLNSTSYKTNQLVNANMISYNIADEPNLRFYVEVLIFPPHMSHDNGNSWMAYYWRVTSVNGTYKGTEITTTDAEACKNYINSIIWKGNWAGDGMSDDLSMVITLYNHDNGRELITDPITLFSGAESTTYNGMSYYYGGFVDFGTAVTGNQGLDGISPEIFKLRSSDGTEYVEILCTDNFID